MFQQCGFDVLHTMAPLDIMGVVSNELFDTDSIMKPVSHLAVRHGATVLNNEAKPCMK
jgi:hypothetical protein